jgi:gliding motility-associated-like protein
VITDGFNCTVTSNPLTVGSGGFPTAGFTITPNPTLLGDTTFFNNTASSDVVSWYYYSDNGYTFNTTNGSYVFPNRGIYTICQVVTNNFGCQDSICAVVSVDELDQEVQLPLPNIITPNNDGKNDVLFITGNDANHNITIFNRWGQIVFQSSPYLNNWNGQHSNGNEVPDGVYYFILESAIDPEKTYTGFVQVSK